MQESTAVLSELKLLLDSVMVGYKVPLKDLPLLLAFASIEDLAAHSTVEIARLIVEQLAKHWDHVQAVGKVGRVNKRCDPFQDQIERTLGYTRHHITGYSLTMAITYRKSLEVVFTRCYYGFKKRWPDITSSQVVARFCAEIAHYEALNN